MCSYCGCDSIEVIGRFMNEHVEIINATGDLRRALGAQDATGVGAACAHLFGLLFGHTSTEEVGLFTVMKREAELAPHIDLDLVTIKPIAQAAPWKVMRGELVPRSE